MSGTWKGTENSKHCPQCGTNYTPEFYNYYGETRESSEAHKCPYEHFPFFIEHATEYKWVEGVLQSREILYRTYAGHAETDAKYHGSLGTWSVVTDIPEGAV